MNDIQVEGGLRSSVALTATLRSSSSICIHHSGRRFITTPEHASIFLRRVQQIADRRICELVPLLHSDGVDLLLISAASPLQVHDVRDRSFEHRHTS
jgi:hypothetical protein